MDLEKNRKKIPLIIIVILAIGAAILLVTQMEIDTEPEPEPKTYHELEVQIEDQTRGTVEITPEKEEYEKGEEVTLTATPDQGWEFARWSGDHQGENPEITIKIDENKQINAHFKEEDEEDEDDEEETEIEEAFVLEIKSPVGIETVPIGREIQTIYTITNEGETTDTQTVELRVNGETIDSREHTLQPGETQEDTFRWTPQQQEQQMRIGTVRTSDNVIIPATEYPEANTPVETMEAYLWALEKVSFVGAETYTTGEQAQYYRELTQEERSGIRASIEDLKNIPEILEKEVDEEEGTATIHVEITREGCEDEETDYYEVLERKYHFTEEQGEWKIEQIEQIE